MATSTEISATYLTIADAAKIIRVSSSLVRRWVRNGTLPSVKIGDRGYLLPRKYVQTFAKIERKRGPKPA